MRFRRSGIQMTHSTLDARCIGSRFVDEIQHKSTVRIDREIAQQDNELPQIMTSIFRRCPMLTFCNMSMRANQHRFIHIEKRLEALGIELPTAPSPKANYNIVCHASGNMLYISGHLPIKQDGTLITGRIGPNTGGESIPHGYEAARYAGLNIISTLKEQLGDLDRVEQIVKVSADTLLTGSLYTLRAF